MKKLSNETLELIEDIIGEEGVFHEIDEEYSFNDADSEGFSVCIEADEDQQGVGLTLYGENVNTQKTAKIISVLTDSFKEVELVLEDDDENLRNEILSDLSVEIDIYSFIVSKKSPTRLVIRKS